MFIRKTKIKSGPQGKPYYTYRIVETSRTSRGVIQRTLLNLGIHFTIEPIHWTLLAKRIEEIVQGRTGNTQQQSLFNISLDLDAELEASAQRYAAQIIIKYSQAIQTQETTSNIEIDHQHIDLNSLEAVDPKSIGIENLAYQTLLQLQLDKKLKSLGFHRPQLAAAMGNIIGRMASPSSERDTHRWLQNTSGLGELIEHDFETTSLTRLYTIADDLLIHKTAIEEHLYQQESDLFQLNNTIALYDLTNTYFEGQALKNELAKFGRSKEKRTDCPLVTLGLVVDSQGFVMRSEVFAGNASEPKTLTQMITGLASAQVSIEPTIVVLDAGIASQENLDWLVAQGYHYLVVSRDKKCQTNKALDEIVVKADKNNRVTACRELSQDKKEVRLYCHSEAKEKKEQGILTRFSERFEDALTKLKEGLKKKGTIKKADKIQERIGRIKQKNSRVSSHYSIEVTIDETSKNATDIQWVKNANARTKSEDSGRYCLRSSLIDWKETRLWQTYTMLTEVEACFRCMKSELGLRPVYHQKTERVTAHLFITLIAYHVVHTTRYQLKQKGINLSWESLRDVLSNQHRITFSMNTKNGEKCHLRITTKASVEQQKIFDALGMRSDILGRKKTLTDKNKICSAN